MASYHAFFFAFLNAMAITNKLYEHSTATVMSIEIVHPLKARPDLGASSDKKIARQEEHNKQRCYIMIICHMPIHELVGLRRLLLK